MGWRGTLRAMEAASRRAERESQRRYRSLQRQAKEQAKREVLQQAAYEVEVFENQLERLTSVHKEAPEVWDWNCIYSTPPPTPPERSSARVTTAAGALNSFKPGFIDKLLGRADAKRQVLAQAVETAIAQDEREYQVAYQNYCQSHTDWSERCDLAGKILQGDTQAYTEALIDYNPFADIGELGASMEFKPYNSQLVEVRLTADGERLIPSQIKSLTSIGKLSVKEMPKGQCYQMYLDFVCGVALRAGRELFAFLPVQLVLVNIQANLLNTRTGHRGVETILSVAMSRTIFSQLNFDRLDPSDAMENFPHRMDFRKTSGFAPVAPFDYAEATAPFADQNGLGGNRDGQPISAQLPSTSEFRKLLAAKQSVDGLYWISAGEAARLIGFAQEQRLGLPLCRRIAEAVQDGGYCIEPDARHGGGAYEWAQSVAVFRPVEPAEMVPSSAYQGTANLLRLCLLVAAADGTINADELAVFRQVIETQLNLNSTERKRLSALECVLAKDASVGAKTLSKAAKAVPDDKRMLVARVLVNVAAVDRVITKSEFGVLQRVFKAFDLPAEKLSELILQVCPSPDETTVQEAKPELVGETIPHPGSAEAFSLDMSRVYAITSETKEVVGILSVVMQDEEAEVRPVPSIPATRPPLVTPTEARDVSDGGTLSLDKFTGLDPSFRAVLERLLAKDSWPRSEFHALASEFHLMPLSIHDVINEWADESLGDFLLEGEDPVVVRRDLIQKDKN